MFSYIEFPRALGWSEAPVTRMSMAANWPGEMVVRMRDVFATPGWC